MRLFESIEALMSHLKGEKQAGKTIGFVPTMGALHLGHMSLIYQSISQNDITICSIFVNPTQFNDPKDLEKYPRTLKHDLSLLTHAHCNIAFTPSTDEMYPESEFADKDSFDFGSLERVMEGKFRPGHFKGVAQIVNKLFLIVQPNVAYFGEKDFQQLAVIRALAKKSHPDIKIVGCETLRENDGLAMSSRNALLTAEERKEAAIIYSTLVKAKEKSKKMTVEKTKEWALKNMTSEIVDPEYFEFVDSITLEPISDWSTSSSIRACVAVRCGNVRLIDNISIQTKP